MSDTNYQIIKKDQMIDYLVECMVPDGNTKITATVSIEKEPEARPEIIYLSKMLGKNNEGSDKIKELEAIVGKLQATVTSIQRDRGLIKEI